MPVERAVPGPYTVVEYWFNCPITRSAGLPLLNDDAFCHARMRLFRVSLTYRIGGLTVVSSAIPAGLNISRPSTRFGLDVSIENPDNCRACPIERVGTGFSVTCARADPAERRNIGNTNSFRYDMDIPLRRDADGASYENIKHHPADNCLATLGRTSNPRINSDPETPRRGGRRREKQSVFGILRGFPLRLRGSASVLLFSSIRHIALINLQIEDRFDVP